MNKSDSSNKKKHSIAQKFLQIDENLGDIETEIQIRRQEAINKSIEVKRRLSTAPLLAGYSASQLTQHCKDVIKLSTENKINCKNAFNFWLIDAMAAMAKKNDSEINKNFQVASCTLDASVKIYGYRVDAIHTDAVKIAGGVLSREMAHMKDVSKGKEEEEEDKENENNEEDKKSEQARAKTKIKKRKKLTIASSESLNAKTEAEVFFNIVAQPTFLNQKTNGNDLLVKIPKCDDGGLLILDTDNPCYPFSESKTLGLKVSQIDESIDQDSLFSILKTIDINEKDHLCPAYRNFEFGQDTGSENSDEDVQKSQNSPKFEFDAYASLHDVSLEDESDNQRDRVDIPVGGLESDEEIILRPERKKTSEGMAISEMKYRITVNPLEYSMFDEKTFKAWAGPAYWKVRPMRTLEKLVNSEVQKPGALKRTRKGKIMNRPSLFDTSKDVLNKNFLKSEKTTLFKSTMLNWSFQNTTMPKDLKCQSKNLFSLYHIPMFSVTFKDEAPEVEKLEKNQSNLIEEDLRSSSPATVQGEDCECKAESEDPDSCGSFSLQPDEVWDSVNILAAPNKVEKNQVSAFKRKKHVDIKHLKRGIWSAFTCEDETNGTNKTKEGVKFDQLLKKYSSKMPKNFRSIITAPLVFNALLHLTNEKCLVLTQNKLNKFNFLISQ